MNERIQLTKMFSDRLVKLLIQNGDVSRSANTGVKVKNLAEKAGCSFEMARRYTNGNALPDPLAIKNIAEWLNVDPGWLLYGSAQEQDLKICDSLVLNKFDLKLLLERIIPAYLALYSANDPNMSHLHDFFCDVIADFARMNAAQDIKLKILETSIASALHFLPYMGIKNIQKQARS